MRYAIYIRVSTLDQAREGYSLDAQEKTLIKWCNDHKSTPMGRAMIGIIGIFAQLERELTSERVSAAIAERAAQGKRTCSEILGYDLEGKDTFKINEREAEYVRFCFNEYLLRKNLSEVAEEARKRGYKGKRGKTPAAYSVQIILSRPQYCGYNTLCGNLYKGNHPSIIDVDTYNRVQSLLHRQGKTTGRRRIKELIRV